MSEKPDAGSTQPFRRGPLPLPEDSPPPGVVTTQIHRNADALITNYEITGDKQGIKELVEIAITTLINQFLLAQTNYGVVSERDRQVIAACSLQLAALMEHLVNTNDFSTLDRVYDILKQTRRTMLEMRAQMAATNATFSDKKVNSIMTPGYEYFGLDWSALFDRYYGDPTS